MVIKFLAWVGIVRLVHEMKYDPQTSVCVRQPARVRWPVHVNSWTSWKIAFFNVPWSRSYCHALQGWFGVFRNSPGVIKWQQGRLLPRRWGFYILGLEIGDRG